MQVKGTDTTGSGKNSMGATFDPYAFAAKVAVDKYKANNPPATSGRGGGGSASTPAASPNTIQYGSQIDAKRAQLMTGQQLADLYGITYNRDVIEKIFQDATKAEFDAKNAAYNRSSKDYYLRLAGAQDASLDAMRKMSAVQSGANAGMQNANALSAVLGVQQTAAPDALALTQEFRALQDEYAAAITQNTKESLEYANTVAQALGALASNIYGVDAQQYAAELGYNAQIQSANTAASAQGYAADQNLAGVKYNADSNLAAARAAAAGNVAAVKMQMAAAVQQGNTAAITAICQSAIGAAQTPQQMAEYVNYFLQVRGYGA